MSDKCFEATLNYHLDLGSKDLSRNIAVTTVCKEECPLNGLSVIKQDISPTVALSVAEDIAEQALFEKMRRFCPVLLRQQASVSNIRVIPDSK